MSIIQNLAAIPRKIVDLTKKTFFPSAQVGAERRLATFGTTSKIPAIATAAAIASAGALTLPSVAGATSAALSRMASAPAENVLQTAVRYIGASPISRVAAGDFAGATAGVAAGVLGTAGVIETGNVVQALATGNYHALAPSTYQAGTILGAGLFPGAAHVAALLGFAGRGLKAAGSAVGEGAQNVIHDIAPHVDFAAPDLGDLRTQGADNARRIAQIAESLAGRAYSAGTGAVGYVLPSSEGGGSILPLALLAALAGGAAYAIHRKHKKHRNKKRRRHHK